MLIARRITIWRRDTRTKYQMRIDSKGNWKKKLLRMQCVCVCTKCTHHSVIYARGNKNYRRVYWSPQLYYVQQSTPSLTTVLRCDIIITVSYFAGARATIINTIDDDSISKIIMSYIFTRRRTAVDASLIAYIVLLKRRNRYTTYRLARSRQTRYRCPHIHAPVAMTYTDAQAHRTSG